MWGAIILGGGSGQRMGAKCNKVLLPIAGKSMIVRSVEAFVPLVEQVVVVSREEDMPAMASELAQNGLDVPMVSGGATRQESVWRGLQALSGQCDGVLVHDGARCLVTADVIQRCMASVEECGTGVAAVPVTDTIKTVSDANIALDTPNRTALRAVQTPQGFKTDLLRQAHEQAQRDGFLGTDDASLVERLGVPVQLTEGSRRNIKLTTPEDLLMAEAFFAEQALPALRVGQGYDVHRLVEGRPLILCGVTVPHTLGLLGHSDADVALHALMDAMLGAMALGDIGKHFPDTDPAYAGADSLQLAQHVARIMREKGWKIVNIDSTLLCQKPKLAPYIPAMRENLAAAFGMPVDAVSVKATTEEHLGFTGEGLGIAAHAVALIEKL